jgi:hypothetical protein
LWSKVLDGFEWVFGFWGIDPNEAEFFFSTIAFDVCGVTVDDFVDDARTAFYP